MEWEIEEKYGREHFLLKVYCEKQELILEVWNGSGVIYVKEIKGE